MSAPEKRGTSFLVRLWQEPRGDGMARVYVRDLRSGEESYLKNVAALSDYLDRRQPVRESDRSGAGPKAADAGLSAG